MLRVFCDAVVWASFSKTMFGRTRSRGRRWAVIQLCHHPEPSGRAFSVPSEVRDCANAQYHQTICAVLSHSRARATFQINTACVIHSPIGTLHCLCVCMAAQLHALSAQKKNLYSVYNFHRGKTTCCPWGGRKIGHSRATWSTVCSSAPHSQATEEAIPHLCKQEKKTSDTGAESIKPNPRCSGKGHSRMVGACVGDEGTESRSVVLPLSIPSVICPQLRISDFVIRWTD